MDLLSSIRKEGSRGGVDFKWSDVSTSQHRENYLGHSLMAPVGRWQKNRDLSWYAKGDSDGKDLDKDETADEKRVRERKEEIRRIKEAEEDALARALGLPVVERGGVGTGANGVDVREVKRVIKETEVGDEEIEEVGRAKGFGDFVGKVGIEGLEKYTGLEVNDVQGGLVGGDDRARKKRLARLKGRSRSRSRSRDRRHRRHRHRERSRDDEDGHRYRDRSQNGRDRHKYRERDGDEKRSERRQRSRSPIRRERRNRRRSEERHAERRDRSQSPQISKMRRRSRSNEQHRSRRDDLGRRDSDRSDPRDHDRRRDGERDRYR